MKQWVRVAAVEDCPPGTGLEVIAAGRVIALFNIDGRFFALDGVCPHQGGPLGKGELSGCVVTCPWHGWQFDVTTGQHQTNASICHERFDVQVDHQDVLVSLEA